LDISQEVKKLVREKSKQLANPRKTNLILEPFKNPQEDDEEGPNDEKWLAFQNAKTKEEQMEILEKDPIGRIRMILSKPEPEKYRSLIRLFLTDQPMSVILNSNLLETLKENDKFKSDLTQIVLE